jgi:hypothetical protein
MASLSVSSHACLSSLQFSRQDLELTDSEACPPAQFFLFSSLGLRMTASGLLRSTLHKRRFRPAFDRTFAQGVYAMHRRIDRVVEAGSSICTVPSSCCWRPFAYDGQIWHPYFFSFYDRRVP